MEIDNHVLSPFYENVKTITPLTKLSLGNKTISKIKPYYKGLFINEIILDNENFITLSESKRYQCEDFNIRVIIRFCKLSYVNIRDITRIADDHIPMDLKIFLNSKPVPLPRYLPYDKYRKDGRRYPQPIDITDVIMDHYNIKHRCIIRWTQDKRDEAYYFMINLVRQRSYDELTAAIVSNNVCPVEKTTTFFEITEQIIKTSTQSDLLLVRMQLTVSLICPLSLTRIKIPVRGRHCLHLQCFDCQFYLAINLRKPTWQCPVCDEEAPFHNLEVDSLLMGILNDERSTSTSDIRFNEAGQWKCGDKIADEVFFDIPEDCEVIAKDENSEQIDDSNEMGEKRFINDCLRRILAPCDWAALTGKYIQSKAVTKAQQNTNISASNNENLPQPVAVNLVPSPSARKVLTTLFKEGNKPMKKKRLRVLSESPPAVDKDKDKPPRKVSKTDSNSRQTNVESFPLEKTKCHQKEFYSKIVQIMSQSPRDVKLLSFDTHEKVPKVFRTTDCRMKFWIARLDHASFKKLGDICPWRSDGVFELHTTKKPIALLNVDSNSVHILHENATWRLEEKSFNMEVGTTNKEEIIALEFREYSEGRDIFTTKQLKFQNKVFCSNILKIMSQSPKDVRILSFDTNEKVPNMFRTTDCKMNLWIVRLDNFCPTKLSDICPWRSDGVFELHTTSKSITLLNENGNYHGLLPDNITLVLDEKSYRMQIGASLTEEIFALEFREHDKGFDPKTIQDDTHVESAVYCPTELDFGFRYSFIRKDMDLQSIRSRLLFIDGKFSAQTVNSKPSLLSISIINYSGLPILNTLVTPRNRVSQFGEDVHGITESMVRDKIDEYDCIGRIHQIVKDKILVGYNLKNQLTSLYIPKNQLMGIRDLSAALVFKNMNIPYRSYPDFFHLRTIEEHVCKTKGQSVENLNSYDTARLIWKIYKIVETKWVDHNEYQLSRLTQTYMENQGTIRYLVHDTPEPPINRFVVPKPTVEITKEILKTQQLPKKCATKTPASSAPNQNLDEELGGRPECDIFDSDDLLLLSDPYEDIDFNI